MGAAESRYAAALFHALASDHAPSAEQALSNLSEALTGAPDLCRFLANPTLPVTVRKETALSLLPVDAPDTVRRFVALLADRKRLAQLPGICDAFRHLAAKAANRLEIRIVSARPLDEEQLTQLKMRYLRRYHAESAVIRQEVDPGLLGGLRVQIGDRVIDGTLRARLDSLRTMLADHTADLTEGERPT